MAKRKSDDDTYSYKGWLVSDKFHRRALAVLGYSIVASLALYVVLLAVVLVFVLLFALIGLAL